jgi:hypothetical protein
MKPVDRVVLMIIRITGVFQLVVGLLFWTRHALSLIPLHMAVGATFVLAIWILAIRAAFSGVARGFAAVNFIWGAIVLALGMTQMQILPGANHWVIRALHFLVGVIAMGFADRLGKRIRLSRSGGPVVLQARPA